MRIMPETRATRLGEPAKRMRASSFCLAVCLVLPGVFIGWARCQSTPLMSRGLTAQDGGQVVHDVRWVEEMREAEYLQSKYWRLPDSPDDLRTLFQSLEMIPGDARLMAQGKVGPFQNRQPFFYWEECVPNLNGTGGPSPDCEAGNAPPGRAGRQMNYDLTF